VQTQSVYNIINQNFNIVFLNALCQNWRNTKYFQCIGEPKKQNLILYLDGYEIKYTTKDGNTVIAHSGDVVYTPVGSEYRADITQVGKDGSHTTGINFLMYDFCGQEISLSDKILIFHPADVEKCAILFKKAASIYYDDTYIQKRILLLRILESVTVGETDKSRGIVTPALEYLAVNPDKTPSISFLAGLCNISEGYFRKQFRLSMGVSPVEYRNRLRLQKACTYLEYGDMSVQEISDMIGYATVSHFIKEFRARNGVSPLKYRKNMKR